MNTTANSLTGMTLGLRSLPLLFLVFLLGSCTSLHGSPTEISDEQASEPDVAALGGWRVKLVWTTETESNAFGFYVHRANTPDSPMQILNLDAPLHAAGTTSTPQAYTFYDLGAEENQTYFYKLEQIDLDGTRRFIVGHPIPVPADPKRIGEDELEDILTNGAMHRKEQVQ